MLRRRPTHFLLLLLVSNLQSTVSNVLSNLFQPFSVQNSRRPCVYLRTSFNAGLGYQLVLNEKRQFFFLLLFFIFIFQLHQLSIQFYMAGRFFIDHRSRARRRFARFIDNGRSLEKRKSNSSLRTTSDTRTERRMGSGTSRRREDEKRGTIRSGKRN